MKCKYKYLLPDLLQEKLTQADFNIINEHLKSCAECRREYVQLSELFNKLKIEKLVEPDERYWINLPIKIRSRIELKNISSITRYVPQLAISISAILIFSLVIFKIITSLSTNVEINTKTELDALLDSINQTELLEYEENIVNNSNELEIKNADEFVIKSIILTSNNIDDYYLENVGINSLRDEEIKYLLSYLNKKNF